MSRPLLALGVIAAATVVGVWLQTATNGASSLDPAVDPTAPIGHTETSSAVATADAAAPVARASRAPRGAARQAAPPAEASPSPGVAMRIARDPETGQLTAPEHTGAVLSVAEIQALARLEAEGLVTIRNADGSETLNHEGRFTDYTIVRRGPDGRPKFSCVHGQASLEHAMHAATPAHPSLEDR